MTTALAPGVSTTTDPRVSSSPSDTDNPAVPHPAYLRMQPRWTKCRALFAGTQAIRDGEQDYLPRFDSESDASYDLRVQLAALSPGFARVVTASVGMLLQQEPMLGADMPTELVKLWENVDGAGTHGAPFCADLLQSAIVDGHDGILTDYANPDSTELDRSRASAAAVPGAPLSGDDEARIGLRPYWVLFKADDVIKPLYRTVNGVRTLVLLILREIVDEEVGRFGVQSRTKYRVYRNDRGTITCEVWAEPRGGGRAVIDQPARVMRNVTQIPWSPLRAGQKVSEVEDRPPLENLADLAIELHQTKTNFLWLQSRACVPTLVRIGAPINADGTYPPIVLGPSATLEAPLVEGMSQQPIYWLTPDVSVLEPARLTIEAEKAEMGAAGMAFLAPQTRAAETAEAKRIDSTAQNATLSTVSRALQDCLEMAFGFAADYLKLKGGSVTVNKDWEASLMGADVMQAYIQLVAAGFPKRAALEMLQAGGRIKPDADLDAIQQEWEVGLMAVQEQKQLEVDAQAQQFNGNGNGRRGPVDIEYGADGKPKRFVPSN